MDPHEELVRELRKDMKSVKGQNAHLQAALRHVMEHPECTDAIARARPEHNPRPALCGAHS